MKIITSLRYIGNALVIIGYFILIWIDIRIGLAIKLLAGILLFPSFFKLKMWDAVIVCSFYFSIEISKLIQLIFPNLFAN